MSECGDHGRVSIVVQWHRIPVHSRMLEYCPIRSYRTRLLSLKARLNPGLRFRCFDRGWLRQCSPMRPHRLLGCCLLLWSNLNYRLLVLWRCLPPLRPSPSLGCCLLLVLCRQ
jgi:hypothetical protein